MTMWRPAIALSRRTLLGIGAAAATGLPACAFLRAQAGAAPPSQDVAGSAPALTPEEQAVAGEIEELLDRQALARASGDREAYMATIDQRNLVWRRIQGSVFDASSRQRQSLRVTRVQLKPDGYYKAWIEFRAAPDAGAHGFAVWVFRQTDQGWLHSEPLIEELGPRITSDSEHFRMSYYAWDEDVLERTMAVAEAARAMVTAKLAPPPVERVTVSMNPTFGSHSALREFGTWAAYLPGVRDLVLTRSLESFGATTTAPGETQDDRLLVALAHEYTHLVNDHIVSIVKIPHWMSEGLAEYVAGNMRRDVVTRALAARRLVPLERASEAIEWGTDPVKGYTLNDVVLGYAEAAWAVAYFIHRFGQDAFFDLSRAYAESRRWEESFSGVTQTTWANFQDAWQQWLREQLMA
jgi:hypothetical protein